MTGLAALVLVAGTAGAASAQIGLDLIDPGVARPADPYLTNPLPDHTDALSDIPGAYPGLTRDDALGYSSRPRSPYRYGLPYGRHDRWNRSRWSCPGACTVTDLPLRDNYRRGYADGLYDGLHIGAAHGYGQGWSDGYSRGRTDALDIDLGGFSAYPDPSIPPGRFITPRRGW